MTTYTYIMLAALLPWGAACTRDNPDSANAQTVEDTVGTARRLRVIDRVTTPYQTVSLSATGRVTGTVTFAGKPPSDTVIQVAPDQNGCAKPLTIKRLERRNGAVINAVVWITDIRAGRPLPLAKRFELENNDCAWDPVMQATVAGGTLNIVNSDPLVERAFATDVATGDTVGLAPFTDDGQIVPNDRMLRTPGVYEWSVESRPMSRAWVAVFDHPYFAITDGKAEFDIDSVPPGTHTIRAWHPMLGVVNGTVTVEAGKTANVTLKFP